MTNFSRDIDRRALMNLNITEKDKEESKQATKTLKHRPKEKQAIADQRKAKFNQPEGDHKHKTGTDIYPQVDTPVLIHTKHKAEHDNGHRCAHHKSHVKSGLAPCKVRPCECVEVHEQQWSAPPEWSTRFISPAVPT